MKALVVTAEHALELRDVPTPAPGPHEALVRIRACGICSTTDAEIIRGTLPFVDRYPCVLGHEAVGRVVETGPRVRNFAVDDWVTRPAAVLTGMERDGLHSGWGGFAEYGLIQDGRAVEADGGPPFAENYMARRQRRVPQFEDVRHAVLAISLAEVGSWFRNVGPVANRSVVVAGTGIAGYCAVISARLAGAATVVILGRRRERLDLGVELGADLGVNVNDDDPAAVVRDACGGAAAVFCECVGNQALFELGLAILAADGLLAVYGVPPGLSYTLPLAACVAARRVGCFPCEEYRTYDGALEQIRNGTVPTAKLLTHRWPLTEFRTAFAEIAARRVVKGMLTM